MINLFSDTQTKPTPAMRAAMAAAEVGDEQLGEDPTVNHLQSLAANMLGKEAALFLPSGTMCNLIAVKTHTQPGDMILADRRCHILRAESGGAAMVSGVLIDALDGERGIFSAEQVRAAIPATRSVYHPHPTLLCIENTHNYGGGSVWPMERLRDVCAVARERGLKIHMDGARLFNALARTVAPNEDVAAGGVANSGAALHHVKPIAARDVAACADSVWIDLSKGLGCPVGAVLAGTHDFIDRARRYKHALGGAMRQAGIIAAAGIYALENNLSRLRDDNANALRLAEGLRAIAGVRILFPVETNIVFFEVAGRPPADFAAAAAKAGVRFSTVGGGVRAVTHLDVSTEQIDRAVEIVRRLV